MKQEKTIREKDRKIVTTYTLDNGYRVRVATYHHANAKVIRSTISECIARQEATYSMETHRMFSDYNALLISESVARYAFKLLEDQHARAIELGAQITADLLAQGQENARECQLEVVA